MRNAFVSELKRLADIDNRVMLLSGDIGNRMFDSFKEKFSERFYNCGVAEQNMTGFAAGLALSGLKPITYTITPFNTFRCLEQIKIDVCYHNLPVIIIGVGAGLSYSSLGPTHHSCEDIAILRSLPNMSVLCPADAMEVKACLRGAIAHDGPVYIRIGKKNEPVIHNDVPEFSIGKSFTITQGNDICILSTGNILPEVLKAKQLLEKGGVSTEVVSMPSVKPLDIDRLTDIFTRFENVVSVEEHSLIGGFGSAIGEWYLENKISTKFHRIGLPDCFHSYTGNQESARKLMKIDADGISSQVKSFLD